MHEQFKVHLVLKNLVAKMDSTSKSSSLKKQLLKVNEDSVPKNKELHWNEHSIEIKSEPFLAKQNHIHKN